MSQEDRKELAAMFFGVILIIGLIFLVTIMLIAPAKIEIKEEHKNLIIVTYKDDYYILKKVKRKQSLEDRWEESE